MTYNDDNEELLNRLDATDMTGFPSRNLMIVSYKSNYLIIAHRVCSAGMFENASGAMYVTLFEPSSI